MAYTKNTSFRRFAKLARTELVIWITVSSYIAHWTSFNTKLLCEMPIVCTHMKCMIFFFSQTFNETVAWYAVTSWCEGGRVVAVMMVFLLLLLLHSIYWMWPLWNIASSCIFTKNLSAALYRSLFIATSTSFTDYQYVVVIFTWNFHHIYRSLSLFPVPPECAYFHSLFASWTTRKL